MTQKRVLTVPKHVLTIHKLTLPQKNRLKAALKSFLAEGYLRFPDILIPSRDEERHSMLCLSMYTRELDMDIGLTASRNNYAVSKRFQLLERIETQTAYNNGTYSAAEYYNKVDSWFSALFMFGNEQFTCSSMKVAFFMKYRVPFQFPPSSAKIIYSHFKPRSVLDPCFGWGDRFAAAVASPSIVRFVGVDPRAGAAAGFQSQCDAYADYLPDRATMIQNSSFIQDTMENAALPSNSFDLAFTSPPYFNCKYQTMTEHYKDTILATSVDEYHTEILFPILKAAFDKVAVAGHLVIVIHPAQENQMEQFMCTLGAEQTFKIPFVYGSKKVEKVYCWVKQQQGVVKTCQACTKTLLSQLFETGRRVCRTCIAAKKKERAAAKNGADEPHVAACVLCGLAFDPTKFTWRNDVGRWRPTCHTCTTPAAASAAYKKRLREKDEEKFKKERREYMRDYRERSVS